MISSIIPSYNWADKLLHSVKSILNQILPLLTELVNLMNVLRAYDGHGINNI